VMIIAYNVLGKERTVALDDIMQGVRMHDTLVDLTAKQSNPYVLYDNIILFRFQLAA